MRDSASDQAWHPRADRDRSSALAKSATINPGGLAYAAQALGLIFYVLAIWFEVYLDTAKARTTGADAFGESHRRWRLRSSLLFCTWTILGGLTLPFGFGLPVLLVAYLWFATRVLIGWLYWKRGLVIGRRVRAWRPEFRQDLGQTVPDQFSEQS